MDDRMAAVECGREDPVGRTVGEAATVGLEAELGP